ncbi:hypothetical protein [uncultured Legionella sp.]|uniref:hypothetical protein n=1 Tax=uncultured Legionella sp. TaxID=210934 RepID=UPI0026325585|nr:hypothetical protein [uncultured Legionella sp.]
MSQRLVWNFEFSTTNTIQLARLVTEEQDEIKWERRFFWSEEDIISLSNIDNSLLDLANYQQKHKEDIYFILPNYDYNIKLRRNELLYKPIINQTSATIGFGHKINLEKIHSQNPIANAERLRLEDIARQARHEGIEVFVKKESFVYKFPTTPNIKLELARLEVKNKIYFSACVEGKSLYLVEFLSDNLLGKQVSCEYVTFLKKILKI